MKRAVTMLFCAVLGLSISAYAADKGHQESKPRLGGVMVEVNEIEYELVARDGSLVIHVTDHGKPIATKDWTGNIAVVGGEKMSTELVPSGESQLEAKGGMKLKAGTRLLATINAPGRKPVQVRYTTK